LTRRKADRQHRHDHAQCEPPRDECGWDNHDAGWQSQFNFDRSRDDGVERE
jgi:hypothetical protein